MTIHHHTHGSHAHHVDAVAGHGRVSSHSSGIAGTWLKAAVMGATGGYLLFVLLSGNAANYINLAYAPLTYLAAALLLLLAAVAAWDGLRSVFSGHGFDHVSWIAVGILAIPVLLGVLVPSKPLGAADASGRLNTGLASSSGGGSLPAQTLDWNVLDWITALNTANDPSELNGLPAQVDAFVKHSDEYPPDHFVAIRLFISCCVVDGQFAGVPVQWHGSSDIPTDAWVRVTGEVKVGEFLGEPMPIIVAKAVEVSEEDPDQPYLYR